MVWLTCRGRFAWAEMGRHLIFDGLNSTDFKHGLVNLSREVGPALLGLDEFVWTLQLKQIKFGVAVSSSAKYSLSYLFENKIPFTATGDFISPL